MLNQADMNGNGFLTPSEFFAFLGTFMRVILAINSHTRWCCALCLRFVLSLLCFYLS